MSLAGVATALTLAISVQAAPVQIQVQPTPVPETAVEDVVVTARTRAAVRDFVATASMADVPDRQMARFDGYVCSGVSGMRPAYAQALNDRIAQVGYALGLNVGGPGCHANIRVVAAANAAQLAPVINDLAPGRDLDNDVSRSGPASVRRLRDPRPVRWWHRTQYVTQQHASRLLEPGRVDLVSAVVMLDMERVGDVNFEALIDYITLVVFAQIDPDATFGDDSTVLGMFHSPQSRLASSGFTAWDSDYLTGLYAAPTDGRRADQEAFVASRMMRRARPEREDARQR